MTAGWMSRTNPLEGAIQLRDTEEIDLPLYFDWQRDPVANQMAAFTAKDPNDRNAFMAHWSKILNDDSVVKKTIVFEGRVVGSIAQFEMFGQPSVAYWIAREHWGQGFATEAVSQLLREVTIRPLYARAAKDNVGSLRVLEKCGFKVLRSEKGFAESRGREIEEVVLELK